MSVELDGVNNILKTDTISEVTSGGGVTIDGLLIKDGGISGDVSLIGTTPTFTIGDAGAEDAALVFDGNAQDFYIALDDSADDLIIGLGAAVGTTPMLSFTEAKAAAFTGAVTMASTLGVTGVVTGAGFTAGNAVLAEAELELLDGLTAGTAIASKVVTTDGNIDTTGMRNLTISGELDAATGDFSGAVDIAGATTVAALTASGTVTVAAGINFPDTQSKSSDVNTLDDYEEGTWDAAISCGSGTVTVAAAQTTQSYIKIGRKVFLQGAIVASAVSSPSGTLRITGIPYAIANDQADYADRSAGSVSLWNITGTCGNMVSVVFAGSTNVAFQDSGTQADAEADHWQADAEMRFSINYETTA